MPRGVVTNTSPIQYLYQIGRIHLLPRLYTEAIVPPAVKRELAAGRSMGVILPDLSTLPWLHEHIPSLRRLLTLATTLGDGEREALALALETPDSLLMVDDGQARRIGRLLGLAMTGTVGVLARAKREGLIPQLAPMLDQLAVLGFRLSAEARATALRLVGEDF